MREIISPDCVYDTHPCLCRFSKYFSISDSDKIKYFHISLRITSIADSPDKISHILKKAKVSNLNDGLFNLNLGFFLDEIEVSKYR